MRERWYRTTEKILQMLSRNKKKKKTLNSTLSFRVRATRRKTKNNDDKSVVILERRGFRSRHNRTHRTV